MSEYSRLARSDTVLGLEVVLVVVVAGKETRRDLTRDSPCPRLSNVVRIHLVT